MARFHVRFKGMLNRSERERLLAAGIAIEESEPSRVGGIPGGGRPIYTVGLEAGTAEQALAEVRQAIEPDTGNFTDWEVEAA
jgi:hypothetical protein